MEHTRTSELARALTAMRGAGLQLARTGPHRLRTVASVEGAEFIDDSASTFLDAALFSILDLGRPLVWITDAALVGAFEGRLKEFMAQHVDAIVFHGEADTALVDALHAELGRVYCAESLRTAVFAARELAVPGGRVLFSPAMPAARGAANHAERGAEYERAVRDL